MITQLHTMKVYFSGVDMSELRENVDNFNIYLSLIVGMKEPPVAKVAFLSEVEDEIETTFSFRNIANNIMRSKKSQKKTRKVMLSYDCKIDVPQTVSDEFIERYQTVKKSSYSSRNVGYYGYKNNGYANPYSQAHKNKTAGKQKSLPLTNKFSDDDVEQFLCKMVTANPASNARNLWSVLNSLHKGFKKSETEIINALDDSMSRTLGKTKYDKMDVSEKLEFLQEGLDYLEVSDIKNPALSIKFEAAKAVADAIISILITNDEQLEEEEDEIIGFQGSF